MLAFVGIIFVWIFSFILYCLKLILYLVLMLLFALWKHQGSILYQRHAPSRKRQIANNPFQRVRSPSYYHFDYHDFYIETKDKVSIHCWLIRQPNSTSCATIVSFHGNAGNIGYRLPNAYFMFKQLNCNILMVDYRGYGNSEGCPTQQGLMFDAEAVLNHLSTRNDINPHKIIIFGRSLGGAIAIDLVWRCSTNNLKTIAKNIVIVNNANNNSSSDTLNTEEECDETTQLNIDNGISISHSSNNETNDDVSDGSSVTIIGLIIENTFTSILDMVFVIIDSFVSSYTGGRDDGDDDGEVDGNGNGSYVNGCAKYLRIFLKYFITNPWDSLSKISDIKIPVLFLSGLKDELIPPKQMKRLYSKSSSLMSVFQTYVDGDHNCTWQRSGQQYWDDIFAFLTSAVFMDQEMRTTL